MFLNEATALLLCVSVVRQLLSHYDNEAPQGHGPAHFPQQYCTVVHLLTSFGVA